MLESSLSLANVLALLGALIVLAIIPSVSVLAVSARAAAFGFTHGMFTAFGIVIADIIFILLAVYGLALVAELMGEQFTLIKYLGGVYLVWLGISLWRADARARKSDAIRQSSLGSSFLTGFLITLGDQKAILFYLGFFPAFIDLSLMTPTDTLIIIIIAIIGVGGAKLVYAYLADRASLLFKNTRAVRGINMLAGSVMIAVGVVLLLKAGQWM
ncbi:MAG: LysE family translocator [Gammaproteobacteria bacterium]|jgi:threonine/homoserine/homoserine lactone efflux protein